MASFTNYNDANQPAGEASRLREMNLNSNSELQSGTSVPAAPSGQGYAGFPPAQGQSASQNTPNSMPSANPTGTSLIDKFRQSGTQPYNSQPAQLQPAIGGPPQGFSQGLSQSRGGQGQSQQGASGYEWVADLLAKLWPYITEAVSKEASAQLPGLIKSSKPTWMGDINLHKIELGGAPPRITDIRVVKNEGSKGLKGDDYIHLEMDFDWDSTQDVEIDVSPLPDKMSFVPNFVTKAVSKATSFRCGIEKFEMFGNLLVSFRPLMHQLPVVGAFQISFTESPDFDFDVTLGEGNAKVLDMFPALKSFLYGFIADTLLAPYITPDHYFYPMDPKAPDLQIPVGYVEVEVIEAKNVPKMDLMGSSDVYVEVMTHKRGVQKTETITSKNPTWNATYKMPIMVPQYQNLTLVMWDSDTAGDDEIGRARYRIRDLQPNRTEDLWLPIKPLLSQDKEGKDGQQASPEVKKSRRERMKHAITKPIGPPDPQHSNTAIHVRVTYRELDERQVTLVLMSEQNKVPIQDPFLKELLKEDVPTGTVAGDHAQQPNAAPTDPQDVRDATSAYPISGHDRSGAEMVEMQARPVSADPEIARTGEESGLHSRGPPY